MMDFVHLDEKWFFLKKDKQRFYLGENEEWHVRVGMPHGFAFGMEKSVCGRLLFTNPLRELARTDRLEP
ncbi:hypothetical protein F444_15876 [Phytophthora nicotianae P1976]|uniref:Uncharacterized protein n=1 Tax=Phytophthora nicotianae P1976 TaxID=1317066 RepID=A0A080ZKG2_PHYNI|nr:hypothetical protein F444_15876 [Phytophthora nicotianae P1976]